jgi:deazaflavin-dependent oxidoreductase (nitroreductase family)
MHPVHPVIDRSGPKSRKAVTGSTAATATELAGDMARMLQKFFMALHTTVLRRSGGRLLKGFRTTQFLVLHTTGRKSGQERMTPLNFVRDGEAYVLIASNGGSARQPDWYLNLRAHPEATVEEGGRTTPVTATIADGEERERLWKLAVTSWGAYNSYQRRTDRTIPVIRLAPKLSTF